MTRLNQYSEAMSEAITRQEQMLLDIQEQLNSLSQEIRVNQQLHKGQQTFEKEITNWLKQGEKLMKDSASLYPKEALENIVSDVQEVASKVAEDYEELATSSRFLTGAVAEEEPLQQPILDVWELPEAEEADGVLTTQGIQKRINQLDSELLLKLASMSGTRAKTASAIAKHLYSLTLTEDALQNLINTAQSLTPRALSGHQLTIGT